MIRAVLDTNTLISVVINVAASVSVEIYRSCKENRFLMITSSEILSELDAVLRRERMAKFHQLADQQLQKIVNEIAKVSLIVSGEVKVEVARDPSDDKVISTALAGKADYIVTRDRDLLDLKKYKGIKLVTPEEFMGILRK